jgi:hypothetical protein
MVAMFHAFAHLLVDIFVRWYTFLGTSPGGIAAQIIILVLTEVQGGWWKLEAWKKSWKGGLRRAGLALALVWLLTFVVCTITTVYVDHQGLVGANGRLAKENERLKNPTVKAEELEKQKRFTIRTELGKLLDANNKTRENCMNDKPPTGFSCMSEYLHWRDQTRNYISKNMEPPYLARFKATIGTHMEYKTSSGNFLREEESDAVNLLTFSGVTLDEFIREFQN